MSCFGELFARYTDKLMELCVDEACQTGRLYCFLPDRPPWQDACVLCERLAFDDGAGWWHEGMRTCDSGECTELWLWIKAPGKEGGNKRREMMRQKFGTRDIWAIEKPLRRETILTTRLLIEAQEIANVGNTRQRVAA